MAKRKPLAQIAVVKQDSQIPVVKPNKLPAQFKPSSDEFVNEAKILRGDIGGTIMAGIIIISIFIGLLGTWIALAPLEGAVVTSGVLKVVGNRKRLQHLDGGIVSEVLVKEGDLVQVDQLLVRLEDTQARAAVAILTQQYDTNLAQQVRLLAERAGVNAIVWPKELKDRISDPDVASVLATQENLFLARRSALEGQVAVLRAKVSQLRQQISAYSALKSAQDQERYSIEDEVKGLRELFEKGFITRSRLLELERNATRLGGTAKDNAAQISRTQQAIEEAELQMIVLRNDRMTQISTDLRETETRLLDILPRLQTARDSLSRTEVRAPYAGKIIGLAVHAKGNVINRGDNLLDIVPLNNELIVEAMVKVDDIKHVSVGQKAKVRLTAYTQRQINQLEGVVELISADRFTDSRTGAGFYSTNIKITDKILINNPQIQLQPGMSATVMIETAPRTTFDYMMQPIAESLSKALREPK